MCGMACCVTGSILGESSHWVVFASRPEVLFLLAVVVCVCFYRNILFLEIWVATGIHGAFTRIYIYIYIYGSSNTSSSKTK